jgi:hypothetical protein
LLKNSKQLILRCSNKCMHECRTHWMFTSWNQWPENRCCP